MALDRDVISAVWCGGKRPPPKHPEVLPPSSLAVVVDRPPDVLAPIGVGASVTTGQHTIGGVDLSNSGDVRGDGFYSLGDDTSLE